MTNERVISDNDLASSLSQMAESTTTAELLRKQGQTKRVKVLSERVLMDWIRTMLNQHLASKQDSYSDQEKEELLAKTRDELRKRMQAHQEAEKERDRVRAELESALSEISANSGSSAGLEEALKSLRTQLAETENARQDLEQDLFDLQDQLQEKLNLLSSTIAEKDRMRDAVRNQMLRSNALVEGVLGLDATYYASRHQEENPVSDDANDDEQFYHDFELGAKVIETLSRDLEALRTITAKLGAAGSDGRSLDQDLELLSQVKAGDLHAFDVAAPVSGLVEALAGARAEAEALDAEVAEATGGTARPISDLPDGDGDPAQVLAGATAVVRELAAELARDRGRIAALRNLSDEADTARNQTEEELEALRLAHRAVLDALAAKAPADIAAVFADEQSDEQTRIAAIERFSAVPAAEIERLRHDLAQAQNAADGSDEAARGQQQAIARTVIEAARGDERLADTVADLALGLDADSPADPAYGRQVIEAVEGLAQRKLELERGAAATREELDRLRTEATEAEGQARAHEEEAQRLRREAVDQVAAARAAVDETATAAARVEHMRRELDEALLQLHAAQAETEAAKADANQAIGQVRELEHRHADRIRMDKVLAGELLAVTRTDDLLADVVTDLSVAIDDDREIGQQLQKTVSALAQRQQSLSAENTRLARDSDRHRAEVSETKRSLAETQRRVAETVIQAAKDDADLKDSVHQLEWALERLRPGEPMPADLLDILTESLAKLAGRKQTLQQERDEMALSGKEIIGALTVSRDQREAELKALREDHEAAVDQLSLLETRAASAESANRDLAEALSRAASILPGADDIRVDLELALSQLPDDGEEGIAVPADLAAQIANHGNRVIDALAAQQAATGRILAATESERDRLAGEVAEKTALGERYGQELVGVRRELAEARLAQAQTDGRLTQLGNDLARSQGEAKQAAQELAEARNRLDHESEVQLAQADELSLRRAELEGLRSRLAELEQAVSHAGAERTATANRFSQEQAALRKELADARLLTAQTESRAAQLGQDVARVQQEATIVSQALTEAQKQIQQLTVANRAEVDALGARLAKQTEDGRRALGEAQKEIQQLTATRLALTDGLAARQAEIDALTARTVEEAENARRALSAAHDEIRQLAEARQALTEQAANGRSEIEALVGRIAASEEVLNRAQAEIAEFHARGGATGDGLRDELVKVRSELAAEREALAARDGALAELREKHEAAEARAKRLRDEFTKRLEERDQLIQQKDRELDAIADRKADLTGLQAHIEELTRQLGTANNRIHDLETQTGVAAGASAGVTGRHSNLGAELKRTQSERDLLREQKRTLEADLVEAKSLSDEITAQKEELRREFLAIREEVQKRLDAERSKSTTLTDELGRIRAEKIGLETRLRKLSEGR